MNSWWRRVAGKSIKVYRGMEKASENGKVLVSLHSAHADGMNVWHKLAKAKWVGRFS
jgi:hypothetical protein